MIDRSLLSVAIATVTVGLLVGCPGDTTPPSNMNDNSSTTPVVTLDANGVGFPTSGDALIIVEERADSALGSAVYYGVDDGTAVKPTAVIADAGDEALQVTFDDAGNPVTLEFGAARLVFTHLDAERVDVAYADASGNAFTDTDVTLAVAGGNARLAQQLRFDELTGCATGLIATVAGQVASEAVTSEQLNCLFEQGAVVVTARSFCLLDSALEARLEEVRDGCPQQEDPAACADRVEPWLQRVAKTLNTVEGALQFRVRRVVQRFPDCIDDDTIVFEQSAIPDTDGDGVPDNKDLCMSSAPGAAVNRFGCAEQELGVIACTEFITEDTDCVDDGCCNPDCLIDPDCTNRVLCDRAARCCADDGVCDPGCPTEEAQCQFCLEDGTCIEGCFPTPDPDCGTQPNDNTGDDNDNVNDNDSGGDNVNDNEPVLTGDPCIDTPTNWGGFAPPNAELCFGKPGDLVIERGDVDGDAHINFPIQITFDFTELTSASPTVDDSAAVLDGTILVLTASNFEAMMSAEDTLRVPDALRCLDAPPGDDEFIVRYSMTIIDDCGVTLQQRVYSTTCCSPSGSLICGNQCDD